MFAPETHRRDGSPRFFNPMMIAVVAGALVMSAAMGVRQTFGLFIGPFRNNFV